MADLRIGNDYADATRAAARWAVKPPERLKSLKNTIVSLWCENVHPQ